MIHDYAYANEDENAPDRDTWVTPRELALKLGRWDLDPCSNERSHIISDRRFELERCKQDGIVLGRFVARSARVFINPPYSHGHVERWVDAYAHVQFCYLLRFDPSTEWFAKLWPRVELICVLRERINFDPPPGVETKHKLSNPFPHALYFKRACDATPAILAASYLLHPQR